eukprot:3761396-Pyramimonas_sp.AAC.1
MKDHSKSEKHGLRSTAEVSDDPSKMIEGSDLLGSMRPGDNKSSNSFWNIIGKRPAKPKRTYQC